MAKTLLAYVDPELVPCRICAARPGMRCHRIPGQRFLGVPWANGDPTGDDRAWWDGHPWRVRDANQTWAGRTAAGAVGRGVSAPRTLADRYAESDEAYRRRCQA